MARYGLRKTRKNMRKKYYLNIIALIFISACSGGGSLDSNTGLEKEENYNWRLVTAWPKNYPGLGMAPERIAKLVEEMSNGQMKITVYGAGEQVPAFGVFDAVSSGSHQMGHSGGYFWKGKAPAAQFFTGVPFGLTADEINAWTQ